jgi:molybdopterin-guanine dinucleotide biosynthesis protein A
VGGLPLAGGILAGGRGTRVGGADKGLLEWRGRRLVEHVLERLRPQVDAALINANRHIGTYAALGHPVVGDAVPGFPGPLAGIGALLAASPAEWMLCVPVDVPGLPLDLGRRLSAARGGGHALRVAHDGQRRQVLCLLAHRSLAESAAAALARGDAAVHAWQDAVGVVEVDFGDVPTAFANLNQLDPT